MSFGIAELFSNKKVVTWEVNSSLPCSDEFCIRLSIDPYENEELTFHKYFAKFIDQQSIEKIDSLVIGCWGEAYEETSSLVVKSLVDNASKLSSLKHLFIGDLAQEDAEVSWIQQSDLSSIYDAFPLLETLKIRGSECLSLGELKHSNLQRLIIETGGMSNTILQQIITSELPQLNHLELWLGDDGYGCDIGPKEITQLLESLKTNLATVTSLGLRNYYQSDDLAQVIANVGLSDRIEVLDLSNGNLSDKGAEALLNSGKLSNLKVLDLHHHYLSGTMMTRVAEAKLAPAVNLEYPNEADEYDDEVYRYIFVSE